MVVAVCCDKAREGGFLLPDNGEGGMGMVYRVRDRETSEILALKLLRPEIARDPAMLERFRNEIRLAHRITHKNVCCIYDFNRVDDVAYITMEVDGESFENPKRSAPQSEQPDKWNSCLIEA